MPELRAPFAGRVTARFADPGALVQNAASSQTSGFTPGFASVLECGDGSRHFVKAASAKAQRMFADAYRAELETNRLAHYLVVHAADAIVAYAVGSLQDSVLRAAWWIPVASAAAVKDPIWLSVSEPGSPSSRS